MICEKCDGVIYQAAMSVTKCKICGYKIVTPHAPGGRVCPSCSVTQRLCEQCGEPLEEIPLSIKIPTLDEAIALGQRTEREWEEVEKWQRGWTSDGYPIYSIRYRRKKKDGADGET